jgi:predicted permease
LAAHGLVFAVMTDFLADVRYAARVLWKHRGVNSVALVTLALAIGANTAIFSVYNALLVRALPFPSPEAIVQVARGYPEGVGDAVSIPKYIRWRDGSRDVFQSFAAYDTLGSGFNLVGSGTPDRLTGTRVSSEFFRTLGVAPLVGHDFAARDDLPGGPKVVVLSHGLWTRQFGARADIMGQAIRLNDEPYTVIGVMPAGFRFPERADLWTLFQFDPASHDRANFIELVARLRPGVDADQARSALDVVLARLKNDDRNAVDDRETAFVQPLRDHLYGSMRPALLVLLASVAFVLLIACVNVANLELALATEREHEVALKAALGASTRVIVRQLLIENLLLAFLGGAAGVVLASWALPALVAIAPASAPTLTGVGLDRTVLLFSLGLALTAGLLFGLVPAWGLARPSLDAVLREGAQRATGGRSGARVRGVLVSAEVALALVLTIGAALLIKHLASLQRTDPGFGVENVLTMKLSLPEAKYGRTEPLTRFSEQIEARLGRLPGVSAAAIALTLPLEIGPDFPFSIDGKYVPGTNQGIGSAQYRSVGTDYFATLHIALRNGRLFTASDRAGALPVAIVNETAARRYWPGLNPVGRRLTVGQPLMGDLADTVPREIVGIVQDVREQGLDADAPAMLYVPIGQQNDPVTALSVRLLPLSVVVRSTTPSNNLAEAARAAVWAVDPAQPVSDVRSMQEIVSRSLGSNRFNTLLLGLLAGLALLLSAVGLYGVLAHLVTQRTREIGVRMALGASGREVLGLFLRQGLTLVTIGIVVGSIGAAALSRLMSSLLTGSNPRDPIVFVIAPTVMVVVALLAIARPAFRATRIDPVKALRAE